MPLVKVYHVPNNLFSEAMHCGFSDYKLRTFFDKNFKEYISVAEVDTGDLDHAYRLTNTINCSWWENHGVVAKFEGEGCRSTSVGDLLMVDESSYLVAADGFLQIK